MDNLEKAYCLGILTGWFFTWFVIGIVKLPDLLGRRNRLLQKVKYLVDYRDGVVTIADLVLEAEISPEKAKKFLVNLAEKLEIEPEVEETTGVRFYRFVNGREISRLKEKKRIK